MLEFDDIQYILLTRAPAITGRYEFLSFRNAAGGRAWLAAVLETVHSVEQARASVQKDNRWVSVAFTWNGLRALGMDEASLATFPEEFKQGMVARAEMLGDTGANHPQNWVGGLAGPELHALVILFARDAREWKYSRHSIWRQRRHSSMRTTTSATATVSRSRLSREPVRSPHPVPVDHSSRVNSFWVIPTKRESSPIHRNPRSSHATAATWPTVACRSMSAPFATFCASRDGPRRSRN